MFVDFAMPAPFFPRPFPRPPGFARFTGARGGLGCRSLDFGVSDFGVLDFGLWSFGFRLWILGHKGLGYAVLAFVLDRES